jgi:S-adenosylmethionine:tRNA ribosyltransferase-isomerase
MALKTSDFDFTLPDDLIAQAPLLERDHSRLLTLNRTTRDITHHRFDDLPSLLEPGDLLVVNNTRVIPARFFAQRETGGKLEGLFIQETSEGEWRVLLKNAGRCKLGERLALRDTDAALVLQAKLGAGEWTVALDPPQPAVALLDAIGQMPLPPYIQRKDAASEPADRQRYQTVYADRAGAVAAPTAGLHFTPEIFDALTARDIQTAAVTLHVGLGTFLPVKVDSLEDHPMHAEWYELSPDAAAAISTARAEGRRIVAVGTTSIRVLETVARAQAPGDRRAPLAPASGWTDIFLYPPADFGVVDALVTNFHLPQSTLVMLIAAFCDPNNTAGVETILDAYQNAIEHRYRFFSYGDAMLIL